MIGLSSLTNVPIMGLFSIVSLIFKLIKSIAFLESFIIRTVLLQLILRRCSMEIGLGYDDMISCTEVVSVSTLCSRCSSLAIFLLPFYVF